MIQNKQTKILLLSPWSPRQATEATCKKEKKRNKTSTRSNLQISSLKVKCDRCYWFLHIFPLTSINAINHKWSCRCQKGNSLSWFAATFRTWWTFCWKCSVCQYSYTFWSTGYVKYLCFITSFLMHTCSHFMFYVRNTFNFTYLHKSRQINLKLGDEGHPQ